MIMRRVLTLLRRSFPVTHILVRGDGHFSGPELMCLIDSMDNVDFILGFACNTKLMVIAESTRMAACRKILVPHTFLDIISGKRVRRH